MARVAVVGGAVDLDERQVKRGATTHTLSEQEVQILRLLLGNSPSTVPREALLAELGYRRGVLTRALDNAVMRLRVKIEVDPSEPQHLCTTKGVGYAWRPLRDDVPLGRAAQFSAIEQAMGSPWITLWGPGGVGKSTLARALARRHGGVVVDLRAARSGEDLGRALLAAFGGNTAQESALEEGLQQLRGAKTRLVVLDAPDALAALDRDLLGRLMQARPPQTTLLATSRERLGHAPERLIPLEPLNLADALSLLQSRLPPGVSADDDALVPLALALDGLPLALELAASWLDLVLPHALADRVLREPRILEERGGSRSLLGMLDASWALLDEPTRRAFACASLFPASFDLAAAEGVWPHEPERWALQILGRLRDKSLIAIEPGPRYRLLSPVRSYARWRLGEDRSAISRYCHYWLEFCRSQSEARDRVEAERPSVDAAFELALAMEPALAAQIVVARHASAWSYTTPAEALTLLRRVVSALSPTEAALHGRMLWHRAQWLSRSGSLAAADEALVAAIARSGEGGDPVAVAGATRTRGFYAMMRGELDLAEQALGEALALAEQIQHAEIQARALSALGELAQRRDQPERAESCWRRTLDLADRAGLSGVQGDVLRRLALMHLARMELPLARVYVARTAEHEAPKSFGQMLSRTVIAWIFLVERDWTAARDAAQSLAADGFALDRTTRTHVQRIVAVADWAEGKLDAAQAAIEAIEADFSRQGRQPEAARAAWMLRGLAQERGVSGDWATLQSPEAQIWACMAGISSLSPADARARIAQLDTLNLTPEANTDIEIRIAAALVGARLMRRSLP